MVASSGSSAGWQAQRLAMLPVATSGDINEPDLEISDFAGRAGACDGRR
jgi:hypothetical protein